MARQARAAGAHVGARDRAAEMGRAMHRGRTHRGSAAARAGREEPARAEGLAQASRAIIRQAPMTTSRHSTEPMIREAGRDDALAGDAVAGPGRPACRPAVPIRAGVVMPNGRWCQLRYPRSLPLCGREGHQDHRRGLPCRDRRHASASADGIRTAELPVLRASADRAAGSHHHPERRLGEHSSGPSP